MPNTGAWGPLWISLSLAGLNDPTEIRLTDRIAVEVSASTDDPSVCVNPLAFTVLRDGVPTPTRAYYEPDPDDPDLSDPAAFVTKPIVPGTYTLAVSGSYGIDADSLGQCTGVVPVEAQVPLFTIPIGRRAPASTKPLTITSSGTHYIVSSAHYRHPDMPLTYVIADPEHRGTHYIVCMFNDDDGVRKGEDINEALDENDCYDGPWPLRPKSYITRTKAGWTLVWKLWWERMSVSECVSYAAGPPKGSLQLLVANEDGVIIGSHRHRITVTCRL